LLLLFCLYPLESMVKPPVTKIGKRHQATFLALPITMELTVVGTPHSDLALHANDC